MKDREQIEFFLEVFFSGCALAGIMADSTVNGPAEEWAAASGAKMTEIFKPRLDKLEEETVQL